MRLRGHRRGHSPRPDRSYHGVLTFAILVAARKLPNLRRIVFSLGVIPAAVQDLTVSLSVLVNELTNRNERKVLAETLVHG